VSCSAYRSPNDAIPRHPLRSGVWRPPADVGRRRLPAGANDLDFIAAARQDVPRLVAEVRRLRAALDDRR
jgi:hypothetical protein